MEQGRQIVLFVLLAVVSALLSVSETRSISSLEVSQKNLNVFNILFYEPSLKVIFDYFTMTHFGQQEIKYSTKSVFSNVRLVLRKSAFTPLPFVSLPSSFRNDPVEKVKSVTSSDSFCLSSIFSPTALSKKLYFTMRERSKRTGNWSEHSLQKNGKRSRTFMRTRHVKQSTTVTSKSTKIPQ